MPHNRSCRCALHRFRTTAGGDQSKFLLFTVCYAWAFNNIIACRHVNNVSLNILYVPVHVMFAHLLNSYVLLRGELPRRGCLCHSCRSSCSRLCVDGWQDKSKATTDLKYLLPAHGKLAAIVKCSAGNTFMKKALKKKILPISRHHNSRPLADDAQHRCRSKSTKLCIKATSRQTLCHCIEV